MNDITMNESDKKMVVAALLCFFIGIIGVHRFYVGKAGTANCAKFVNEAESTEVHVPSEAVTVYEVPIVMLEINPAASTVGPVGVNV